MPDDAAETDADDGGQAHHQGPEDHGLHHAGMADGHLGVLTGENPLAELEAHHVAEQGHRECERGHRGGLGRQHEVAGGHGGERRPDHPGGVLQGHRAHGECAEDHGGDHDPGHRGAGRIEHLPLLGRHGMPLAASE